MPEFKQNENDDPIVVVGAGLTGCCVAMLFAKIFTKRKIIILDSRDDYRKELEKIEKSNKMNGGDKSSESFGQFDNAATRSINLALSYRGIIALKECNLYQEILDKELLIKMNGRFVHLGINKTSKQLYGQDHQGIFSISRLTLNCLFINKLDNIKNVEFKWKRKVQKISKEGSVIFNDDKSINRSFFIFGCDGAFSATRSSLQRLGRYNYSLEYIKHGYKELTIFPNESLDFKMEANYLHIWPKHEFMLIGLPNPDKTFTCTLFAPWDILETLNDENIIKTFFEKNFASFIPLCPNYIQQCLSNPSSPLAHLSLSQWNYKNQLLLLGDAAHAIVPFYGQGMNAGFEDCLILYKLFEKELSENNGNKNALNIERIFNEFSTHRQPSVQALSELSLQNYVEMRSLTAKKWFVIKKRFEKTLNYLAPTAWKPIYSMVAFDNIPYDKAKKRAQKQDQYLYVALASTFIATVALIGYKYDVVSTIKSKFRK